MRFSRFSILAFLFLLLSSANQSAVSQIGSFDYKRCLFGTAPTLALSVVALDKTTGEVTINGGDSRSLSVTGFEWHWGDGTVIDGWFPQSHTYADNTKNYVVMVIAAYDDGGRDSAEVIVYFVPPTISPIPLDPAVAAHWKLVYDSTSRRLVEFVSCNSLSGSRRTPAVQTNTIAVGSLAAIR